MTMNRREFSKAYPALSGALGGEFQYPEGRSDEELARTYRNDLPEQDRRDVLQRLLDDCYRLVPNIGTQWEILSDAANRSLDTPEQAKDWLTRIVATWEQSLREIDGTKPS